MSETSEKNPEPELKYEEPPLPAGFGSMTEAPKGQYNESILIGMGAAANDVKKFVRAKPSFWQSVKTAISHGWSHFLGDLCIGKCKNHNKDGSTS